jgi:probable HAF family extracellular repeat protein
MRGQVVGQSAGPNDGPKGERAFLYENDMMMDLNRLIQTGTSFYLTNIQGINDRGEMAGTAFDAATGGFIAFLAVPVYGGERKAESSRAKAEGNSPKGVPPVRLRRQLTGLSRLALGDAGSK